MKKYYSNELGNKALDYINFIFWFDNSTLVLWFRIKKYYGRKFNVTFENWQSEFLQLIWQVAGLSYLWYIDSPESKEEERNQEMLQWIVKKLDPQKSERICKRILVSQYRYSSCLYHSNHHLLSTTQYNK